MVLARGLVNDGTYYIGQYYCIVKRLETRATAEYLRTYIHTGNTVKSQFRIPDRNFRERNAFALKYSPFSTSMKLDARRLNFATYAHTLNRFSS